jgi:hypothetical protein
LSYGRKPERIGDEVVRELARFGTSPGLARLVEAWPVLVGPEISRNAWPARIARDGTLHVHTSSSAWAFELGQLEPRIRESLGELAPVRLRFSVGPVPEPVAEARNERVGQRVEPSPADLERAAELSAPIADEKLRKVVAKAAALSLADADSGRRSW